MPSLIALAASVGVLAVLATSIVIGAAFGYVSEAVAGALTKKSAAR